MFSFSISALCRVSFEWITRGGEGGGKERERAERGRKEGEVRGEREEGRKRR